MLRYIYMNIYVMSSPNSDTMALILVLYICIKWSEFTEKNIKDAIPYTFLCILCVYAATLKLSVSVCVMMAVYPFIFLIKQKKYKEIIKNICAGLVVAIPWLARNVIISGYLLYPYSQLDLFNFDWKMPKSIADYDAKEIMVWGRELKNVELYDMPFIQWFPIWFKSAPKYIFIICIIAVAILVVYLLYCIMVRRRIEGRIMLLFVYSLISLCVWLFSAPLIRYGIVYLYIPICEAVWILLLLSIIWCGYMLNCREVESTAIYKQDNYDEKATESVVWENDIQIWFPKEGDQGGYENFPCVPYRHMVERIELRGEKLNQGFRIKSEYKNIEIRGDGIEL